jgi:beta-lactam-binding protein with PASTA domain
VVGLTLAKAESKIRKARCRTGKITRRASSARKRGKVIGQSPNAGRRLANGGKVRLTVGKGRRR